jgi:hypothetical protein
MEDLYLTNREDGNLVDDKLLAWLSNLESSKTFKGKTLARHYLKGRGTHPQAP